MKALKIIGGLFLVVIILAVGCTAMVAGTATDDSPSVTTSSSEAAPASPSSPEAPPSPKADASKEQAVRAAKNYLETAPFSQKGLAEQLVFEGYSKADAAYGAANSGANWDEQAVRAAKNYLDMQAFSKSGLIEQLEFEGYTPAQAKHGADAVL